MVKLYSAGFCTCFSSASTGLCRPQHPTSIQGVAQVVHVREQGAPPSSPVTTARPEAHSKQAPDTVA